MDEDEDDADSAQSEDSRPEDVSETSSNASDTDDSDADSTDDDADDNTVFDDILKKVEARHDDPDSLSLERLRKLFREEYRDTVLWLHKLRKHPTHQLVMVTAKDFRDGPCDYDYEESIEAAVDQRKHLLNRLVLEEDDDDDAESMDS